MGLGQIRNFLHRLRLSLEFLIFHILLRFVRSYQLGVLVPRLLSFIVLFEKVSLHFDTKLLLRFWVILIPLLEFGPLHLSSLRLLLLQSFLILSHFLKPFIVAENSCLFSRFTKFRIEWFGQRNVALGVVIHLREESRFDCWEFVQRGDVKLICRHTPSHGSFSKLDNFQT